MLMSSELGPRVLSSVRSLSRRRNHRQSAGTISSLWTAPSRTKQISQDYFNAF